MVKRINEDYSETADKKLTNALLRSMLKLCDEDNFDVINKIDDGKQLLFKADNLVEKICFYIMNNHKTKNVGSAKSDLTKSIDIYNDINAILTTIVYFCQRCIEDGRISQENLDNINKSLGKLDFWSDDIDDIHKKYN